MTPPQFNHSVEAQHQRIDASEWDDIYVVGDVHGCLRELETLVDRIGPSDDDLFVFVGDLVRKGPDSKGVVDFVRAHDNMVTIRGNNEEKLLRGTKELPELTHEDLAWIRSLPVAISFEDALVVHGGVDPRKPFDEHDVDDFLEMRSLSSGYERPFWWEKHDGPQTVFFGHTPIADPVLRNHAVGLDTGCVYGGSLTAYSWYDETVFELETDRTVQHRPASKFVTPRVPVAP
ncbi:metallophosphoesterase family protein [Salinigranum sp.]|uniref:metallophosphoesterase family protein n=1 Tax=Salinigranum sp. TaxID=1966351 RepID=UPI003561D221